MGKWVYVILLLLGSMAFATTAQMTPATLNQQELMQFGSPIFLNSNQFNWASTNCGTIAKHALVAKLSPQSSISVALDANTANATELNCIRFDFTGSGKFSKKFTETVQFQAQGEMKYGRSDVQTFTVPLQGQQVPITVMGQCQHSSAGYVLILWVATALQGKCPFADKSYSVRLVNSDGSLRFRGENHAKRQREYRVARSRCRHSPPARHQ